jgi:hypothetical protein
MSRSHPRIRSGLGLGLLLGIVAACLALAAPTQAATGDRSPDGVWSEVGPSAVAPSLLVEKFDQPGSFRMYELDDLALFSILRTAPLEFTPAARPSATILTLPMPDGTFARFRVADSPVLSAKLAAEHPEIKSYVAQGIDNPTHSARFSRSPLGFNALVVTPEDFIIVERATHAAGDYYLSFRKSDLPAPDGMSCTVEPTSGPQIDAVQAPPSGANLRTYDLAIVTTGEFTNFYGAANVLAAVNGHITAVNALYEREVAIRFTLVCTSFYPDGGTDPFTDPQTVDGDLLDEADDTLDDDCGDSNYEIGHLFHLRAGTGNSFSGRAGGSTVCQDDAGRAASTATNPNSSLFVVDLVPHEMGHQFSAAHTYNSTSGGCVERSASNAYEIGSGTTIMSYACAGCTGEDANGNGCADAYFHTHSFDQITNYREAGGNCGAQTATGNTAPGVNAGPDFTIPRGTPFTLTATGSDAEGHPLTWCWEQHDLGAASPPLDGGASGPLFRSFLPVASPSRTFPNLTDLLAGNPTPFEILPTADRTLTFRATARDNQGGGGGVNYDTVVLTVAGDPFVLTYPNGGQSLNAGCTINVQWTVGGGDVAPNVNILFSQDGGLTFPTTLASGVPNDGAHDVVLPCVATTQADARIRIEGAGNIFFDLSDNNFTVTPQAPTTTLVGPTQAEVDASCTAVLAVSGSMQDDCAISAADVTVSAEALGGAATVVTNIVTAQNGAGQVTFSGNVTVSDLTSCPAIVRITVSGTDNCGLAGSGFIDVEVVDTTPPEIAATLNRTFLWPPNHKLVDIVAEVTVTDNCPKPSFVLTSITSNEPDDDLGDGSTSPDIVGADLGTADTEFQLRSERMGPRTGRVYTIVYTASDNCGNTDEATLEVRVEHDQSGNAFVVQVGQAGGASAGDYLAVVVPSAHALSEGEIEDPATPVDRSAGAAKRLEPAHGLIVGNTLGVLAPSHVGRADVDGDGLLDAVAFFALTKAEQLRAGSDVIDGPVGLHYVNGFGESFLVPDLLAVPRDGLDSPLGAAVLEVVEGAGGISEAGDPDNPSIAPTPELASGPAVPAAPIVDASSPVAVTRLSGLRPNPFFRQTTVAFELVRAASVRLEVYSPAGTRVRGLAEQAFEPGRHAVTWDGRDDAGRRASPGVYFVRFSADGVTNTGKALLLP